MSGGKFGNPKMENSLEYTVSFDAEGDETSNIEYCGNEGCGFNIKGKCKANGTECFGYIDSDLD